MSSAETAILLKCLADDSRLRILNILAEGDSYVELIASRLDLTPATVCYHLKKLETAGVVRCSRTQFYMIYSLNKDIFGKTLGELLLAEAGTVRPEKDYRDKVIDAFFNGERLIKLPSQRKKREIVLEKLADSFEPGVSYSEKEVNLIIAEHYEDFCTVRREMVSYGLLERENSIYVRPRLQRP